MKTSWGNSFNGNMQSAIKVSIDNSKREPFNFTNEKLDHFQLSLIILRELCGTYKFKTNHDHLLQIENKFWINLFFWGQVALWYDADKNKFRVCKIISIETNEFSDPIKITLQKASNHFMFLSDYNQDGAIIEIQNEELKNVIPCYLDISCEPFIIKYGWITKQFISIFSLYKTSLKLRSKGFFIFKNNNQEKSWLEFKNSIENVDDPWITISSPNITMDSDAKSLLEKPFEILEFKKQSEQFINIDEVIKFWKFAKDLIGMNANVSQKKERVISSEMEESEVNTKLMMETDLRNFQVFCNRLKNQLGIDLEIISTKAEMEPKNVSKHLENESIIDQGDDNEI